MANVNNGLGKRQKVPGWKKPVPQSAWPMLVFGGIGTLLEVGAYLAGGIAL